MQGKVLHALWAVHWPRLATAAGCRILQNLCAWTGPFLLQQLLAHLQTGAAICRPSCLCVPLYPMHSGDLHSCLLPLLQLLPLLETVGIASTCYMPPVNHRCEAAAQIFTANDVQTPISCPFIKVQAELLCLLYVIQMYSCNPDVQLVSLWMHRQAV